METTFISIHDLSWDAKMLYVSQSIEYILGYTPNEVIGRSCWDYFHPDEIPFAQSIHDRSIQLDKAAVLHYCQIKNKAGEWVGCECVFTIVHDVLVASTSIYRRGLRSLKRAKDAPVVQKLFTTSPRDPRYHMLEYISARFSEPSQPRLHEPRAALFLNRFSRTLTIMYATDGLADILGLRSNQFIGKSFYFCIQEICLRDGIKCLESAKANDSIAYLRFWFRDPRQDQFHIDRDEVLSESQSSDDDDGGVNLAELIDLDGESAIMTDSSSPSGSASMRSSVDRDSHNGSAPPDPNYRSSSGESTDVDRIFDKPDANYHSSTSSISTPEDGRTGPASLAPPIELEAVVSCSSDGLVVILREATNSRPFPTAAADSLATAQTNAGGQRAAGMPETGIFASPWAAKSIMPDIEVRPPPLSNHIQPIQAPMNPTADQSAAAANKGPSTEDFMRCIRDNAVFAWALTGINGSLSQFSRGVPRGESQPEQLQVWDHASADPATTASQAGSASPHPSWTYTSTSLHKTTAVDVQEKDTAMANGTPAATSTSTPAPAPVTQQTFAQPAPPFQSAAHAAAAAAAGQTGVNSSGMNGVIDMNGVNGANGVKGVNGVGVMSGIGMGHGHA